jgi:predicted metal-dependent hydrolase
MAAKLHKYFESTKKKSKNITTFAVTFRNATGGCIWPHQEKAMAIQLTYRRTSRLSMRIVKNGDVHVSAPIGMPKSEIEAFIIRHKDWILKAQKKTAERQAQRAAFYDQLPLTTKAQKAEATERMRAMTEPLVEKYAKIMGVRPSAIRYRPMVSRWGVCNIKDRSICYSTYLLLLPDWCAEHVVVHELCHLLEPSHNARFHKLMDRYFPRWREAKRATRYLLTNL